MDAYAPALLGGAVSGIGAIAGALLAVWLAFRSLQTEEIRRQQVQCVASAYGFRSAMSPTPNADTMQKFLFELNRMGALFSAHQPVQIRLRDFMAVRSNENFTRLIREAMAVCKMDASGLSDSDIQTAFMTHTA